MLFSCSLPQAWEVLSLALGFIFSLVVAALFLPVVRGCGEVGRMLHCKVPRADLRLLPWAGGNEIASFLSKSRFCRVPEGSWRLLLYWRSVSAAAA